MPMALIEVGFVTNKKEAKRLISTGVKVPRVASMTGYRSTKGFKLAFKKYFGEEP